MEFDLGPDLKLFKISLVACSRCSSGSGVWREMEITSLPTQSPFAFFSLIYFSLHRPHYLNAWNRLSALSLLPLLFSVCRILEYPGVIILISRIRRNVQVWALPLERFSQPE